MKEEDTDGGGQGAIENSGIIRKCFPFLDEPP
jgi:hypothetical protein